MSFPDRGIWPNVPAKQYHACQEAFSRSQLEDLRKSPALFYGRHIARTIPQDRSDSLDLGAISHEVMLGGTDRIVVIPKKVLTKDGKRYGKAWDEFSKANEGKWLLKSEAADRVVAMANAAYDEPAARLLLDTDGDIEVTLVDSMGVDHFKLRGRLDKLFHMRRACLDIKTTADPSPEAFARSIARYGYHRQAAWYRRLACSLCDWPKEEFEGFYFIAVGSQPPHDVYVYKLADDAMEQGNQENLESLIELARRLGLDDWELPTRGEIQLIDLPAWAYPPVEIVHHGQRLEV